MLIENATEELHDARRRHERELAERTYLRRLIERIDRTIEECEESHLQGYKEAPEELRTRATRLLHVSQRVVRRLGDSEAIETVDASCARNLPRIVDVMDALWAVQEIVFDLMLPWRTRLPEDVELPGVPAPPWRFNPAA